MLKFNSFMPVEIIFDRDCVLKNKEKFYGYKKIFMVSDKFSAKLSGALNDITSIVNETKADFYIFDKIEENPLLSVCYEGGKTAFDFGADLIVAVGGGSPMDAAKVIALYATNPGMKPEDIYNPPYENLPLPVFAVPTTSGTGSEADPFAVLTLDGQDLKKSYGYVKSYPETAFLDPKYTLSLPYNVTVSTALDALSHCVESQLSIRTTPFSVLYTSLGIKSIYNNLVKLIDLKDKPITEISYEIREELMLGSLCGGFAINSTGTCFPHPMGYNITLLKGLPHGKACGLFLGELLTMSEEMAKTGDGLDNPAMLPRLRKAVDGVYAAFDVPAEKVKENIKILADYHEKFDDETLKFYVSKVKTAKNFSNGYKKITDDAIFEIYKKCVGR